MILDGPLDGAAFRSWIEEVPVSELRRGDVVIYDNLSVHRTAGIRDIIKAAVAELLFLPPFSPELNPVERPSRR